MQLALAVIVETNLVTSIKQQIYLRIAFLRGRDDFAVHLTAQHCDKREMLEPCRMVLVAFNVVWTTKDDKVHHHMPMYFLQLLVYDKKVHSYHANPADNMVVYIVFQLLQGPSWRMIEKMCVNHGGRKNNCRTERVRYGVSGRIEI